MPIQLTGDINNVLTAPVCIDGRGPFPMLVDTGASASGITATLARRLGLGRQGPSQEFFGVGRAIEGSPVGVTSWSVGRLRLKPQVVYSQNVALPGHVDGLLGSDVFSRFGAIRLDYDRAELIISGPEGAPAGARIGRPGRLPSFFAQFGPQAELPLQVGRLGGQAVAVVTVTVAEKRLNLVVDSGAGRTTLDPAAASSLHLKPDGPPVEVQGIGGEVSASLDRVPSWSVGLVHLVPEDVVVLSQPAPFATNLTEGLLGSEVLSQFRAVTIDYSDQILAVDQVPVI